MNDQDETVTYRDPRYCCMGCGCETFSETRYMYDKCVSCGATRDVKRGPNSKGSEILEEP